MRALVLSLVAAALLAAPASAAAPPPVELPRDHAAHRGASIEWWYFSALVHDRAGTPYSVFFTLFAGSGGLVPVSQVLNLRTGALVGHDEEAAFGSVGTGGVDVTAGHARLRLAGGAWSFGVTTPRFAVALVQRPTKPYVVHGDRGRIRQGPGATSSYYSSTRMGATGTLRVAGKTSAIRGESWFDHQWGAFRDDPRAFEWQWFSCRFADRTELMLYQFVDRRTHRPLPALAAGTFVARGGDATHLRAFAARPGPRVLRAVGHAWPLDWRLAAPALHLEESLRALVPDQLVRNSIVPTFWEGAARATGTRAGTCFVELSYR